MVGQDNATDGISSDKLYVPDLADSGSSVALVTDTEATKPPFLERAGLDLDETQASIDGYKVITKVLPQFQAKSGQYKRHLSVWRIDIKAKFQPMAVL